MEEVYVKNVLIMGCAENFEKMISVIMPCFNSQEYVRAAIDSVVNQTYSNWELIVINDGSTDNTASIVNSYACKDYRIKVFSKENGGYISAVNLGLKKVTGCYFMLLGSDDSLAPNLFETIFKSFSSQLPDMIGFNSIKISGNDRSKDGRTFFSSFAELYDTSIEEYECRYPEHSRIFFERDTSKMFKSSILSDTVYYGKTGWDADGIFSMTLAHKATSFMSVPIDGYYWTVRNDSVSGRPISVQVNIDRIHNWKQYYCYLCSHYQTITEREKEYVVYYAQILMWYGRQDKENIRKYREVWGGVSCIKATCKRFGIKLPKKYRMFVKWPWLYLFIEKIKRTIRRKK